MNNIVMAFSLAGLMTCLGMLLRSKVKVFADLLIPVNVIAGVIGLIYMNTIHDFLLPTVTTTEFNSIVNEMFTFSFISIGLASVKDKKTPKPKRNTPEYEELKAKNKETGGASITKGAMGMGYVWCLLFSFTAVVGVGVIAVIGPAFGMDAMYGMLIPYAFCQGPGQAANMGLIFENIYGLENAQMVGLTFAVVGFVAAFGFGVPLAKYGLRKNLQISNAKITQSVQRGYFVPEEQRESMGKVTTHSGNIETLALHIALMGVGYVGAVLITRVISLIPVLGPTFSSMLFIWGMVVGGKISQFMDTLGCGYLLNKTLQNKITGFTSDFLVVCAFMAIKFSVVGQWLLPIFIEGVIVAFITFIICIYFTSRLGSDHDFERTLGMFGMCTGTTPSGIALLRIVDPKLQTNTATELGMTNLFMLFVTPVTIVVTLMGEGVINFSSTLIWLLAFSVCYMVLLKLCRTWNKPTFSLAKGERFQVTEDDTSGGAGSLIQGMLHYEEIDPTSNFVH